MAVINAAEYGQQELIQLLKQVEDQEIEVKGLCGQRYLACGWQNQKLLTLYGVAGNNLAAFADVPNYRLWQCPGRGSQHYEQRSYTGTRSGRRYRRVRYAGRTIYQDEAGFRLGDPYESLPGTKTGDSGRGSVGSFAGEYMAGGTIIVLGLKGDRP